MKLPGFLLYFYFSKNFQFQEEYKNLWKRKGLFKSARTKKYWCPDSFLILNYFEGYFVISSIMCMLSLEPPSWEFESRKKSIFYF